MHLISAIANDVENQLSESQPDLHDPAVFGDLVRAHHRELIVYARALTRESNTANDIVQEAFIVAFDKMDTFDVTRDFPTWMRGIVRNKWREWVRKNKRYQYSDTNIAEMDADIAAWQAESAAGNRTVFDALSSCLERLPENLRETVNEFYYNDQNGEEVAEALGVSPAAIRKRLQRARELLKACVDRKISDQSLQES